MLSRVMGMRFNLKIIFIITVGVSVFALIKAGPLTAEIYRYQDKNGNWHFSDAPPAGNGSSIAVLADAVENNESPENLAQNLADRFSPASGVERASLATVTVESYVGKGSGFFISDQGHILTNRHVLEGDAEQMTQIAGEFEQARENMDRRASWLSDEEDRLARDRVELDAMKTSAAAIKNDEKRRQALEKVEIRQASHDSWKARVDQRREAYEKQKTVLRRKYYQFKNKTAVAGIARNFKIITKDGRELSASLVRISRDHDLALLKLDGYLTPRLKSANISLLNQASEVYAIGSPVSLRDSVSRGVVSGFENGFIKTDAAIYPGNSGGPLVTPDGRVAGINTFKQLTHKFEGLGFAIPIRTALAEFAPELKGYVK